MITIGMNYEVLPGKESVFEEAFGSVMAVMDQTPGHNRTGLYRDVHDQHKYLIVSDWQDRDTFDQFIRSPRFGNLTQWGKEQVLASRPTHTFYDRP